MEIEVSRQYWLDGKVKVSIIKALNRAKTMFCVDTGQSILTVEKERLTLVEE